MGNLQRELKSNICKEKSNGKAEGRKRDDVSHLACKLGVTGGTMGC